MLLKVPPLLYSVADAKKALIGHKRVLTFMIRYRTSSPFGKIGSWKKKSRESGNNIEQKIDKQLQRFIDFFRSQYRHERITAVTKRDVKAWIDFLYKEGKGQGREMAESLLSGVVRGKVSHITLGESPTPGEIIELGIETSVQWYKKDVK